MIWTEEYIAVGVRCHVCNKVLSNPDDIAASGDGLYVCCRCLAEGEKRVKNKQK